MTRILVQRGSGSSSSSNQNRSPASTTSTVPINSTSASPQQQVTSTAQVVPAVKDETLIEVQEQNAVDDLLENCGVSDNKSDDVSLGDLNSGLHESGKFVVDEVVQNDDVVSSGNLATGFGGMSIVEEKTEAVVGSSFQNVTGTSYPPPPPVPPPKPSSIHSTSRRSSMGPPRRASGFPGVSSRSSPTGSRPSSPRSYCEGEGYNSADEQSPRFSSSYDDAERERQFEIDLRRAKGLEVRKMLEDGNCLFRAVADQVYGDSELYDLVRQMCIDYMERERDHFSQFITEGFTSYCKRKRRDKVYGNNTEIQALSEMYNRPIHIYSDRTEPINIFHGSYNTDSPPIRLSYHHGNHYNSLVDPRRLTIGAGLGFSSLQGTNINKDQVKAAIKAQQDLQIDHALFISDLELTENEIERMVMEASRAEYLSDDKFKLQIGPRESSTSRAEPSSSAAKSPGNDCRQDGRGDIGLPSSVLTGSMQALLSMGFGYLQVIEAYSIFGDNLDSMICYLIETGSSGRNKGKATEK